MGNRGVSRREVLTGVGAAGLAGLVVGTENATAADRTEYNVGTESPAAEQAAKNAADHVDRVLEWDDGRKTITGSFSERAIENLRRRPNVRYTEVNGTMHAVAQTTPWGVDRVDADVSHASGETGGDDGGDGGDGDDDPAGGDVAIIDTGIDSDHPDLAGNLGAGYAVVSARGPYAETWDDDDGHGTHCAGIAGAANNAEGVVGVSTGATLHAVKVLDKNGSGSFSDVAEGIRWVADRGYDVGSLSLGASSGSETVRDACAYAERNGVLLVAAAGNSGPCSDCVGYPAAYPEVVAVSATASDDSLAGYSSTGPEVELAAPGSGIYSTYVSGGYTTLSGTSMACPHVSGAGAQLMDNGYSNAEARERLNSTAEDIGLGDAQQGNGLLDVEAALGLGGTSGVSVDSLSATETETANDDAEFDVSWAVSDPQGDLETVELVLRDTAARTDETTASIGVSGDTANGTTTLVATGDEASGHDYAVTATVTDTADNTASATVTTSETEQVPVVDDLSLSEVETSDADAEFDASWSVSDADADLASVDLVLTDTTDGETEADPAPTSVSGDTASGTTRLVAAGDDGSGNSYEVTLSVSDTDGSTASATATTTEGETTPAPIVDSLGIVEDNSGGSPHAEFDVPWAVSDDQGDLATLELTLTDTSDGATVDAATVDVSGDSASGTTGLTAKHAENSGRSYEVEAIVADAAGNTDTATATEVEDGS